MARKIFLFLSLGVLLATSAWGQSVGTINGSVTDPMGAVIPNATITVTEVQTNLTRSTTSNGDGLYSLSSLRPTAYTLTVEAEGFSKVTQSGIVLQANDSLTINLKMSVGSLSQSVTVDTSPAQTDVTTPTISQVVDSERIVELPLNGRNAATLTVLVPGAVNAPSENANEGLTKTFPGAVTISVNGTRPNQISYYLDGVPNIDWLSNVNLPFPMPDALQEFSVQTSNYSAEYGENSGAVVNIVTKSGSNQFHGNVFDYMRNGFFNASNYFSFAPDPLKRQQFGGTIGGPVIHDKLFFFFGYQGTRIRSVTNGLSSYVPTANNLKGDFSNLLTVGANNPLGRAVQLKDPNGGNFVNNQVPTSRFDQTSLNLLGWLPTSSNGNGQVTYGIPLIQNLNEYTGRADYNVGKNDRIVYRYFQDLFNQPAILANHNLLTYTDYTTFNDMNMAGQETHIFTPTLLNEFNFGFEHETDFRGPPSNTPTVAQFGSQITQGAIPAIEGVTASSFFTFGSFPQGQFPRTGFSFSDAVRIQKGRHSMAFGGGWEHDHLYEFTATNSNGVFNFAGNFTGASIADFMLGKMQTFTQGNGYVQDNTYKLWDIFAQDSYKVSKKLTLDFGLRYEPAVPWNDVYHEATVFNAAAYAAGQKSVVYTNAPKGLLFPGDPGIPANGRKSDYTNISPRVGFALDVFGNGKTSLRGGIGEFFNSRVPGFANNRVSQATPFSLAVTLTQPAGTFTNPYLGVNNPFPAQLPPPKTVVFPSPVLVYSWDPTQRLSSNVYAANLTVEQQLGTNWLLRLGYVGSRAEHLNVNEAYNPSVYIPGSTASTDARRIFPGYSTIVMQSSSGNARYNSLQASIQHRLVHGFTVMANYTYSKSIDGIPNGEDTVTPGVGATLAMPVYLPNYRSLDIGVSEFDIRHHLSTSYVWHIPTISGANAFTRQLLGGWEVNGILTLQSGPPITVLAGSDRSSTGIGYDRAVYSGSHAYTSGLCSTATTKCVKWLDATQFSLPAAGTFGNVSKGQFRGPGLFNWDMGATRDFPINERIRIQFRAEYFNVFNHTNLNNPTATLSGAIGNIVSSSSAAGAADPRIAQFALKVSF